MKQSILINLFTLIILMIAILLPTMAYAQEPENPDAPIDGGLGLLVAAGVAYGVKRVRDHRKKNKE